MTHEMSASDPIVFRAVLQPHRSLSPYGFRILMTGMAALSLIVGTIFYLSGAWPIVGFLGLDMLLIYGAFKANYRSGQLYETVELTRERLTVRRVDPRRRVRTWTFQPYWLRVSMDDPPRHHSHVTLSSHGKSLVVGSFLAPEERLDFANALRTALRRARTALHPSGLPPENGSD